jgi:hypothetical protein
MNESEKRREIKRPAASGLPSYARLDYERDAAPRRREKIDPEPPPDPTSSEF